MNPSLLFKKVVTLFAFLSLGVAGEAGAAQHRTSGDEPMLAVVGSSFSDVFTESLTFQTSLPPGHVVLPPVSFSSVSLFDSTDHQVGAAGQRGSNFNYSGSNQAAGLYSLHVSGDADHRTGGGYVVSPQALPTSEPSEWGLMLAGLALVSMIAWRRKRSE